MMDRDPAYETARALLAECEEISREREQSHGGVTEEWTRTATIWSAMLGVEIKPHQAMAMMVANKLSRLMLSGLVRDHYLDAANYMALAWGVRTEEFVKVQGSV